MEFLVVPLFFMIAMGGMLAALRFSKYKQGQSACCGGKNCSTDGRKKHNNSGSCYSSKLQYIDENVPAK